MDGLQADAASAVTLLETGIRLIGEQRYPEAAAVLDEAASRPGASEYEFLCLGQALYMTGRFERAAAAFDRAATFIDLPENARQTQAYARAFALMGQGRVDEALAAYPFPLSSEAAIELAANAFSILAGFEQRDEALAVGRWLEERRADDQVLLYRMKALQGARLPRSPRPYLEAHFDAFAEGFDDRLEGLDYRAPAQMVALLPEPAKGFDHILDLGCGTGLASDLLRPIGRRLTGLDVSAKMLDRARARGLYDRLIQQDAIDFLLEETAQFDLIFAADVLIYFGELEPLFDAVAGALKPGGLFIASTEVGEGDWNLTSSGRYSHDAAYLAAAASPGLEMVLQQPINLRQEGGRMVGGQIHLLRRAPDSTAAIGGGGSAPAL